MSDTCPYCPPFTSWWAGPDVFITMQEWHDDGHPESKEAAVTKKLPAVEHKNSRPVGEDIVADDVELRENIGNVIAECVGQFNSGGNLPSHAVLKSEIDQIVAAINRLYVSRATEETVTRFEVIDKTGRVLVKYDVSVGLSFQDEGRTLKVFLTDTANPDQ